MPDESFLEIFSICTFKVKFSSIYTPRDFKNSTCFIESLLIVKDGDVLKVLKFCLDPCKQHTCNLQ